MLIKNTKEVRLRYVWGTFEVRLRYVEGTFKVFNLFSLRKFKGDKFELPLRYV